MKTNLTISGENFLINGKLVYSEIEGSNPQMHGLLMNARLIQGIFDDKADATRFNRFGMTFDPEKNTNALIAALPEWYRYGLRAFTVGLQGGGPCFTVPNGEIINNPFSPDGLHIDGEYLARLTRLLNAADELGMVVIVSALYCGQIRHLNGAQAVINAVRTTANWLRDGGWKNIIFEPANEYDIDLWKDYPIVKEHQSMVGLLDMARRESGLFVGCSGGGGILNAEVARASDVILFHGNGQPRQAMANLIANARKWAPGKPIVCNEDSQAITNLQVCMDHHVSWGYYNGLTKQEMATDWRIRKGEDHFFALRIAENVGIQCEKLTKNEQYLLMGISKTECWNGKCWPRISSLYPETINYVDFYVDGEWLYRCYDDPFSLYYISNWLQGPLNRTEGLVRAEITLTNGEKLVREGCIGE